MSDSLSKSLSQFIASSENSFENPFETPVVEDAPRVMDEKFIMERSKELKKEKKSSKRKKDKFTAVMDRGTELVDEFLDDDSIEEFDSYIGNFLLDDEDAEFKRNLVRYGRKYARENKVSGENSEISKAYSESEKLLSDLLKEIDDDKEMVQKDISTMRMMRTRNYKTLSELIESKAQFHNTALSVIKEMNSMKKNQFELQMKVDRNKKETEENDSTANKAIQQLFSMGRSSIMNGYEDVSGASEAGTYDDDFSSTVDEDAMIQQKYFKDEPDTSNSDGDKFLQYEGRGVHYILLYDDDNKYDIIAEDSDGNIIPDYPTPSDPENLSFDISESTGTATDNLANQYELRHM